VIPSIAAQFCQTLPNWPISDAQSSVDQSSPLEPAPLQKWPL
jgi:hypothetical protein